MLLDNKILISLVLIFTFLLFKLLIVKYIKQRAKDEKRDRRLVINIINNLFTIIVIIIMINIWSNEIQKFAFSIAAFVVAIVLATKEIIQCFIGFIYLLSNRPFRIGNWIELDHYYGEVTSIDWAKTTILEIDINTYQFTGKTLFIPNSQLITAGVKNLNFLKRYAMHTFTITRDASVNPFTFIDKLEKNASKYCAGFKDVAIRYNELIENRLDIKIVGAEPNIQVNTNEKGDTQMLFTIFCPTDKALEIEQKLTADFMKLWFSAKDELNQIKNIKANLINEINQ